MNKCQIFILTSDNVIGLALPITLPNLKFRNLAGYQNLCVELSCDANMLDKTVFGGSWESVVSVNVITFHSTLLHDIHFSLKVIFA